MSEKRKKQDAVRVSPAVWKYLSKIKYTRRLKGETNLNFDDIIRELIVYRIKKQKEEKEEQNVYQE